MNVSESYVPSGRVNWLRLWIAAIPLLAVILILSDLAFRLDRGGYYPPLLGPVVFFGITSVLAFGAVDWSKCRNVRLGRTIGVVAVLVFYLSFFQRSLIDARTRGSPDGLRGIPLSELVTGLPDYIALRMRNFELPSTEDKRPQSQGFAVGMRWIVFAMELAALVAIGWWLGGSAAKRPFSERHGVWMTSQRFALPQGTGEAIVGCIEGRQPLPEKSEGAREDVVLLEHAPGNHDEVGYVSIYVGGRDARRELTRRRTVTPDQLNELRLLLFR